MKLIFFLSIYLLIGSCSRRPLPDGVLTIDKMQAVYWDYLRADVFANEFVRKDTSKNTPVESARLQQEVFKLHKISRNTFYKSYDYYLRNPPLLKEMLDSMLAKQPKIYEKQKEAKRTIDTIPIVQP